MSLILSQLLLVRNQENLVADYSEEIIKALSVISFLGEKTIDTFNVIASGWGGLISISQAALTDFVNGTNTLSDEVMTEAVNNNREALNELLGDDYYSFRFTKAQAKTWVKAWLTG